MLADERTYEKISEEMQWREFSEEVRLPIPTPLHLIAMKLHALRNLARASSGKDLADIHHLIAVEKIDTNSAAFRAIVDRYASEPIRELFRERS